MMPRSRGLLPGLLFIVVLPLTLVLIGVAIGATTLHQNEMRNLIAGHDQRAAREAAAGLDERISHQLVSLHSIAEGVALGLSPVDELRSSANLLSDFDGGVVVIDDRRNLIASLPQPANPKLLDDLNQVSSLTNGLFLSSSGSLLAIAQSTTPAITAAGSFSAQALHLPTLAATLQSTPRSRVIVVDTQARLVYFSGGVPAGSDVATEPGAVEALRGESGTTFFTDEHQVEWVVAYQPVPSVGWGLIVAEPWEDVVNPLLRTSLLTPLVLVPAFVIAVIAFVFVARRVLRPLQQLGEQAERVGQGDYAALAQPIDGINEIQTLHATLTHMADQIRRYQRSIQSYAADVTRTQEDERARLARELHDVTVQALIALDQRVQMLERTYKRDPRIAATKLTELRTMTSEAIEEVRRVIRALRPIYLEDLGLAPALEMLTQSTSQVDGLTVTFAVEGELHRLKLETELAVYRIVQEALSNIARHAGAKHAQVNLKVADTLQVVILDDGRGFDMPDRVETLTELGHFGLIGMRERAELIGAQLEIRSSPNQGTVIDLHLPL